MIKLSHTHREFVRIKRNHSVWYLGYSLGYQQFVAWSHNNGPGTFKRLNSLDELRSPALAHQTGLCNC